MEKKNFNRRDFIRNVSMAGVGSAFFAKDLFAQEDSNSAAKEQQKDPNSAAIEQQKDPNSAAAEQEKKPLIPVRKFGRHDLKIPIFALGTMFNLVERQVALLKALQLGVTYWDTAAGYAGGNSEIGIGNLIKKKPDVRKDLFIATKASGARSTEQIDERLKTSMERMNTDYIDLYHGIHGMRNPGQLNDEVKKWVEKAKKEKKIKYFGFSTHSNMAECIMAAVKTDYVDAIMTSYNFRLMLDKEMQEAVQAANEKGIALIAMKTQARGPETDEEKELVEYFTKKGFADGQAKIKAVLKDKRFCTACVGLGGEGNLDHLILSVDAVKDEKELEEKDVTFLTDFARKNCDNYCEGCTKCERVSPQMPYIADVMRYMMYYNNYGDTERAKNLFAELPLWARARLLSADFSAAQSVCPNKLPIAKIMSHAARVLV